MPEVAKPEPNNYDDDVRARFAALTESEKAAVEADDLPPVPKVAIQRPARVPQPGDPDYGRAGNDSGRIVGGGMFGSGNMRSSGAALTIGTGLVGSIIVGTLFGWLADKYLLHSAGTPWGLIVGFMLGVTSGFMNLIRVANQLNKD